MNLFVFHTENVQSNWLNETLSVPIPRVDEDLEHQISTTRTRKRKRLDS